MSNPFYPLTALVHQAQQIYACNSKLAVHSCRTGFLHSHTTQLLQTLQMIRLTVVALTIIQSLDTHNSILRSHMVVSIGHDGLTNIDLRSHSALSEKTSKHYLYTLRHIMSLSGDICLNSWSSHRLTTSWSELTTNQLHDHIMITILYNTNIPVAMSHLAKPANLITWTCFKYSLCEPSVTH